METTISTSEKATLQYAKNMSKKGKSPLCICLYGNLGSGKTVFSKGYAEGLGISSREIKSPTYTLIRKYKIGGRKAVAHRATSKAGSRAKLLDHCDFYRILEPDDVLSSDFEEMLQQKNAIILIEWPERIEKLLPQKRTNIRFEYKDENTRIITTNS